MFFFSSSFLSRPLFVDGQESLALTGEKKFGERIFGGRRSALRRDRFVCGASQRPPSPLTGRWHLRHIICTRHSQGLTRIAKDLPPAGISPPQPPLPCHVVDLMCIFHSVLVVLREGGVRGNPLLFSSLFTTVCGLGEVGSFFLGRSVELV